MSVGLPRFNQAIQNAGGIVQRAITSQTTGSTKAVALSLSPLIPMIIVGSALLYNQGNESHKPGGGEQKAWWNILLESSVAYLVLQHTSGVYPLLGIGLAAYRAGQKSNALDQIKAVVNTAITMFMGYVGVQFLGGMSKMADQIDDQAIYRGLRDQTMTGQRKSKQLVKTWLDHLDDQGRNYAAAPDAKTNRKIRDLYGGLRTDLLDLRKKLAEIYPDWTRPGSSFRRNPPTPGSDRFKALADEAMKLKAQAAEKLEILGKDAYRGLVDKSLPTARQAAGKESKQAAKSVIANIHHSQSSWTRMVRGMNPVFGYIMMGLLVGAPLARWVNSWIGTKRPDLQKKSFHQAVFPEDNRMMTPMYGGAHGGGGHGSMTAPYMVFPDDSRSAYGSPTSGSH